MSQSILHPGASRDCNTCMGLGMHVKRQGARAIATSCACVGPCPTCQGTGWVAIDDGPRARRTQCVCARVQHRMRLFNEANIPGRYAHASLENFETRSPETRGAHLAVLKYVQDYRPGEENVGMVFHGPVGRGKTHLMIALIRELIMRYGVSARFIEFSLLLSDLKSSFDRRTGTTDLLEPLSRVTVLAIDEMGKGRNTEFEGTVLDELISRRYNAAATLLATTNYAPGPATGHAVGNAAMAGRSQGPTLPDRVGDRVYSRLRESTLFVPVGGDDYRERKRLQRATAKA